MHLKRIAPLAVLILVSGLILVTGCSKKNNAPVISGITVDKDSVQIPGTIVLTANATDEDNDDLTYAWTVAGGGTIAANSDPKSATWTAPAGATSATATVTVKDASEEVTAQKTVKSYIIFGFSSVQGYTAESTYVAANATTMIPFILDDVVPDRATVESAFVSTDLEPDTVGEFFQIWLVSPAGAEYLVYDGLNGEPDMDDVLIQGIKGETAKGNWRLKVVRDNSDIERYAEECSIDLYYRHY